jgi:hypothetical protein
MRATRLAQIATEVRTRMIIIRLLQITGQTSNHEIQQKLLWTLVHDNLAQATLSYEFQTSYFICFYPPLQFCTLDFALHYNGV